MSNQSPLDIVREAKERQAVLKELFKTKEPFDKDIDFPRKDLRRRYLNLLFVHPYAQESKDAETHLWMQTSYAFISEYKQRLASLDRIIQHQQQQQPQSRHGPHGPVEYRKLLQRFRQFLAEEEKFWTQFAIRFQQTFALEDVKPVLKTLKIITDDVDIIPEGEGPRHPRNQFQFPINDSSVSLVPSTVDQRESRIAILGKALVCLGDIARYRELYNEAGGRPRAGHEDAPPSGGRRSRSRRGGGGIDIPRPRNYEKAKLCYEQAKSLVPHEGNPSHQLAILANYSKDPFLAIFHYYRALCVRQRFDAALDNLNTTLQKELEVQVKRKKNGVTVPAEIAHVPKVRIDQLKDKLVVLHALWKLAREKNDGTTQDQASKACQEFEVLVSQRHLPEDFITQVIVVTQGALWTQRMLRQSPDHRNARHSGKHGSPSSTSAILPSSVVESRIFSHLLSLYRALLEVGIDALRDPPPMDVGGGDNGDLAQRIAVELRRMLPALRIASKWLRANFPYIMTDPEAAGFSDSDSNGKAKEKSEFTTSSISPKSVITIGFWNQYADFLRALSKIFPMSRLPTSVFPLKEDIEMKGWLPLKDTLEESFEVARTADEADNEPHKENDVHPNVMQLMRIRDLLEDGRAIVGLENSPLTLYGNQFVIKGVESDVQPIPSITDRNSVNGVDGRAHVSFTSKSKNGELRAKKGVQHIHSVVSSNVPINSATDDMDVWLEDTSKPDDDPVREAFEHLDYSEEEDEIVWNPKVSPVTSPVLPSPPGPHKPLTVNQPSRSPINAAIIPPTSPVAPLSMSPKRSVVPPPKQSSPNAPMRSTGTTGTTAEDLLNGFMRGIHATDQPRNPRKTSDPPAALPGSALLFGGDQAGNNIWSTSQDELKIPSSIPATGFVGHHPGHSFGSPGHHHSMSYSQDSSQPQSTWGSYNQMPQHHLSGSLSSTNFAAPPNPISPNALGSSQHRRAPSASVAAQLFPSRNAQNAGGLVGHFGYASPVPAPVQVELPHQMDPRSIFNAPYANMDLHPQQQSPHHGNFYDSNVSLNAANQGLHSPHMLPESRAGQMFMPPSFWGKVG
ncbi:hypothetical protein K435DRAFT_963231 [Dendrothele bispora CBS 962.96]|uniref:Protein SMG7 n=1 Tax=Dendrothele bispora (strain CBS 962.96) TaxID=1314807 RepID=A0A4S8MHN0_DENBC|nr:hypothetical protein K435DRAFT_963231 [Dendrothele bispora CBS 962.96]